MRVILLDILYVVAVGAALATLASVLLGRTPWAVRRRQEANRRRAERAGTACAIHGRFPDEELVRLPTGERICPRCYEETA